MVPSAADSSHHRHPCRRDAASGVLGRVRTLPSPCGNVRRHDRHDAACRARWIADLSWFRLRALGDCERATGRSTRSLVRRRVVSRRLRLLRCPHRGATSRFQCTRNATSRLGVRGGSRHRMADESFRRRVSPRCARARVRGRADSACLRRDHSVDAHSLTAETHGLYAGDR